jgi:hypothetical protein
MAEDEAIIGTCHCGRVSITIPRKPDEVTQCNCSLCAKTGFRGIYFGSDQIAIEGHFDSYVRADLKQAYLANHRCRSCGILTHWTLLSEPPHERMGINARLFDEALLEGVPVKHVDGRAWDE